jgi:hypothetical protein
MNALDVAAFEVDVVTFGLDVVIFEAVTAPYLFDFAVNCPSSGWMRSLHSGDATRLR